MPDQKRVLVDLGKLKDLHCGLGQVSLQLGRALDGYEDNELKVCFLVPPGWANQFASPCEVTSGKRRYLPSQCPEYDLWHAIHQDSGYLPNAGARYILTIHDLNFLGEKSPKKAARRLKKLQSKVDRSAAVTTISEFTRAEVSQHLNLDSMRPTVVYQGVEFSVAAEAPPSGLSDKPFLFSIGAVSAKKNLHVLLPMMRHLPEMQLLLAGKNDNDYGDRLRNEIEALQLGDRITLLGRVSDQERNWLYANCQALVFPSLFEGFGMPVIEAYHYGKPVIANKSTAIPEFAGDLGEYFESFAPHEMANAVRRALVSKQGQIDLRQQYAARFSWRETAEKYLGLYKQFLRD